MQDPQSGDNIFVGARVTTGEAKYDPFYKRNVWKWTGRVIALHDGYAWVKQTTGGVVGTLLTFEVNALFNVEGIDPC